MKFTELTEEDKLFLDDIDEQVKTSRIQLVEDFLKQELKDAKVECTNVTEAKRYESAVKRYAKRHLDITLRVRRQGKVLYLSKKGDM